MLKPIINQLFVLLILFAISTHLAIASKIVRLEIEYGSDKNIATSGYDITKTIKTLDLELFDDITPITVSNFLNYVNNGRYNSTFFNRGIPGFVLQTGGLNNFSADPDTEAIGSASLARVEKFPSIQNEPKLSNLRGTIAMAKLSNQPNSASSEWFINLEDNSSNLDAQNGGFTVFGSVIDDGMDIAEEIESFPVIDAGTLFGPPLSDFPLSSLPVADYDPISLNIPFQSNLIMIKKAVEISRPVLRFSPDEAKFGIDVSGDAIGKTINIELINSGNEALDIVDIDTSTLSESFSVQSENCTLSSLIPIAEMPTSSCTLSLEFKAVSTSKFNETLTIAYRSKITGDQFIVTYNISGEGSIAGVAEIDVDTVFDVGTSQVGGFVMKRELSVKNSGLEPLQIFDITGLENESFSESNNCIGNNILILPGDSCEIVIEFETTVFDEKSTTLFIESNDSENSNISIELTGHGDVDADGIVSAIENAASNTGDANFDGTVDSLQNNVASFVAPTGEYLSLVVDTDNAVTRIIANSDSLNTDLPSDINNKYGILEFDVILDKLGRTIEVGLILPSGDVPDAFWNFGMTDENDTPHWYRYPVTQILPNVKLVSSTRNLVKIVVEDGGVGDVDQKENGIIHIGPSVISFSQSGGSGSMNKPFLFLFLMLLILNSIRTVLINTK